MEVLVFLVCSIWRRWVDECMAFVFPILSIFIIESTSRDCWRIPLLTSNILNTIRVQPFHRYTSDRSFWSSCDSKVGIIAFEVLGPWSQARTERLRLRSGQPEHKCNNRSKTLLRAESGIYKVVPNSSIVLHFIHHIPFLNQYLLAHHSLYCH